MTWAEGMEETLDKGVQVARGIHSGEGVVGDGVGTISFFVFQPI